MALAIVAGVVVAQNMGQRGAGPITGAVNTPRAALATCQQASFQDPEGGVECYDEILADAPDNVEALTYQGWALIRLDRVEEGAANLQRAVEIDPDYPDARVFRAIVASRGGDWELAAAEIDRFYRNDPTPAAEQVLQSQGLEREIFISTVDASTRACWQQAAQAQDPEATDAAAFLPRSVHAWTSCSPRIPDNVDALVSRAYASVDASSTDLTPAVELAERAVAAGPEDPNARLLRASLAFAQGRVEVVEADLDVLAELPAAHGVVPVRRPEVLIEQLEAVSSTTTVAPRGASPPTTAVGATTVPVDERVPNPGGG